MKSYLIPVLCLVAGVPLAAQDVEQAELVAKRSEKLASAFLAQHDWYVDFDKAKAAARRSNRVIFAYFTRSYAP